MHTQSTFHLCEECGSARLGARYRRCGRCRANRLAQTGARCTATGCDRWARYTETGLCEMHYKRLRVRGTTAPRAPRICALDGCEAPAHGAYCNVHRLRLRRHATADATRRYVRGSVEERFWAYVTPTDDNASCWEWNGHRTSHNYGLCFVGKGRQDSAHRVSWRLHFGPILDDLFVCHHCDNPPCVRPDHLFLGTHQDNMDDMYAKGRGNTGVQHGRARLTESDVLTIRRRLADGELQCLIAAAFGISASYVSVIGARKAWRHLP